MGRGPSKVSRKVAGLLRHRRRELGFSLREVEERAAALGVRLPTSTLMRIEQGDLDPGLRRWFALIHVYNVELLADAMELGSIAGSRNPKGEIGEMFERGERAWRTGDIAEALAHALAVRENLQEDAKARFLRQRALISFATYARNLGKYRLARQMVDVLLCQPMARPELTDTLVLAASVWRGLGSMEAALAMVERAARRADPEDARRLARVEHQWAKLLMQSGAPHEAQAHLNQALALYQRAGDGFNEVMARTLRVEVLEALGRGEDALTCAREALALAEQRDWGVLAANLRLELGRVLLGRGAGEQAVQELRRALASALVLGNRRLELYAHTRLWKAYTQLGESGAAALELAAAAQLVGRADEKSEELDEVRRSVEEPARPEPEPGPRTRRARSSDSVN